MLKVGVTGGIGSGKTLVCRIFEVLGVPVYYADFHGWVKAMSGRDYIIEEAAILFESGAYKLLDFNIAVSAPEEMRIKRVMTRDNTTRESVLSRLSNQMAENERNNLADAVILNDESELLIPQVIKLHNRIIDIAGKKGNNN